MPPLLVVRDYSLTINNAICLSLVVLSLDPSQPTMPTLLSSLSLHINNVWAIINQFGHLGHTILKRLLWFSLHNIVLCRLSGVGVVHAVSPRYWMLRTSGSLALGKFLKRTSHLFCTLCTPPQAPASHWPSHGNLWNLPQAIRVNTSLSENSGSFKHGQKWKLPMNNDLQWWSIMLTFWTFIRVKNTIRTILLNFYLR